MKFIISIFTIVFFQEYSIASTSARYSFSFPYNDNYSDGVLTINKIDGTKVDNFIPGPLELVSFFKAHPELKDEFESISKISTSDLGKFDNNRKEITFSDLELFDQLKANFKLEKSVNLTQKSRCGEDPKVASTTWDQPATISLTLDPNSIEEIIPGSVLHYSSINIPAGSKLIINNGKAALTYIKSDGDCIILVNLEVQVAEEGEEAALEDKVAIYF